MPQVPSISVIMSVYNDAEFLPEAVESVLRQDCSDFEFIIVDDGSTDDTPTYLASLTDPRLRIISQCNRGLASALNTGLEAATGALIARQDADDVALPNRLSAQLSFFNSNPQIDLLGSGAITMTTAGKTIRRHHYACSHDEICRFLYRRITPFVHTSIMFRRAAALAIGGYDAHYRVTEDYDFYLRLIEKFKVSNVPEALVKLRLRPDSLQGRTSLAAEYGAFARYLASLRLRGYPNVDDAAWTWEELFPRFHAWFARSPMCRHAELSRQIRRAVLLAYHRRYLQALTLLCRIASARPVEFAEAAVRRAQNWTLEIEKSIDSAVLLKATHHPVND